MNSYYNGLITNEEVIKELLKTAEEIANLYKNGQKLVFHKKNLHSMMPLQNQSISKIFTRMMNCCSDKRTYRNAS